MLSKGVAASLALLFVHEGLAQQNRSMPVVDLGYERHRALAFNTTGQYYNFSNIRFAAPPTEENRFRRPQPPEQDRQTVQDGSEGRICPASSPSWFAFNRQWVTGYLAGEGFNGTMQQLDAINSTTPERTADPRTNEDCLFLDVMVPEKIYGMKDIARNHTRAPVLVWIYGGGYTAGNKNTYDPSGLIYNSLQDDREGIVYVAANYRLGAFGFSAGTTVQSDGVANAALYDQRFALEWVQQHIAKFGGDPDRVTVMGESAGGGSIFHQITAFGGNRGPAPFQQAILQSPAWQPLVSNVQQEANFNELLDMANVTSLDGLREVSSEILIRANALQVYQSPYSSFTYGPAVDGDFAPAMPGKLLLQGSFDKTLKIMVGHNADEGLLFTDPFVSNANFSLADYVKFLLPTINQPAVDLIVNDFYPLDFNGPANYTYNDAIGRAALAVSESTFSCNPYYLSKAFGNNTYAYEYSIPPALHGQDLDYTFYDNGAPEEANFNATVAEALQSYITTFVQNSRPTAPRLEGLPIFKMYGPDAMLLDLNETSIETARDQTANRRCDWWQKVFYQ